MEVVNQILLCEQTFLSMLEMYPMITDKKNRLRYVATLNGLANIWVRQEKIFKYCLSVFIMFNCLFLQASDTGCKISFSLMKRIMKKTNARWTRVI